MSLPRYQKYKDSSVQWLGAVPEHWQVGPFKRLVELQNGADHKTIEVDDGYPVYGSGGVFAYASDYLCDGESVLLGRKGTVDRPLHVTGKFWTVDTMYWTRIAPDACGKFCYYAATAIPFAYYSTNTALPSMTQAALGAHLMAFPGKEEQQAIATFLDRETAKIDALIVEQERLLVLLAEKRQATIFHAVTKGLNPDAPMKDSGILWLGEVPAHWDIGPLRRYWSVTDCKHITADFVDDGYPLASIREVQSRFVVLDAAKQTTQLFYEQLIEGGREPSAGDLVFSRNATVGEVAQVSDAHPPFAMGQDVCLLRKASAQYSSDYMQAVIRSGVVVEQLKSIMVGSTFKRVNVEQIRGLQVPAPPPGEQVQIADFILCEGRSLDMLEIEALRAIDLLKERRSALIAAAVTGQIDVRGTADGQAA
ncbi:MAG: restriction endonuclease subunit S [Xanthomonadales bacterium]|nr:restriction endonuclease subunit S [Xanthomonadales bacterium]